MAKSVVSVLLDLKRQQCERRGKILVLEGYVRGDIEVHRSKVPYGLYACADHSVRNLLRRIRGHCDDADLNVESLNDLFEF